MLPILVVFPIHRLELQPNAQTKLVSTLVQGMSSKAAPQCIRSLTLVLLQLQDQMYRKCDQVLSKLAKVSDTKAVALPVLDFLSCLITLPEIFSSFTKEHYNKVRSPGRSQSYSCEDPPSFSAMEVFPVRTTFGFS